MKKIIIIVVVLILVIALSYGAIIYFFGARFSKDYSNNNQLVREYLMEKYDLEKIYGENHTLISNLDKYNLQSYYKNYDTNHDGISIFLAKTKSGQNKLILYSSRYYRSDKVIDLSYDFSTVINSLNDFQLNSIKDMDYYTFNTKSFLNNPNAFNINEKISELNELNNFPKAKVITDNIYLEYLNSDYIIISFTTDYQAVSTLINLKCVIKINLNNNWTLSSNTLKQSNDNLIDVEYYTLDGYNAIKTDYDKAVTDLQTYINSQE